MNQFDKMNRLKDFELCTRNENVRFDVECFGKIVFSLGLWHDVEVLKHHPFP